MKCVGMQYLEVIRKLRASGFQPIRSVYLAFVPDEKIGDHDGVEKFVESQVFKSLNIALVLDEEKEKHTEDVELLKKSSSVGGNEKDRRSLTKNSSVSRFSMEKLATPDKAMELVFSQNISERPVVTHKQKEQPVRQRFSFLK